MVILLLGRDVGPYGALPAWTAVTQLGGGRWATEPVGAGAAGAAVDMKGRHLPGAETAQVQPTVGARYGVAKNPGPSAKKARPSVERLGAHQEEDEREVTGARADHERVPDLVIAEDRGPGSGRLPASTTAPTV
jgi:hypothetical protein